MTSQVVSRCKKGIRPQKMVDSHFPQQSASHVKLVTVLALDNTVLLRCVRECGLVEDTKGDA